MGSDQRSALEVPVLASKLDFCPRSWLGYLEANLAGFLAQLLHGFDAGQKPLAALPLAVIEQAIAEGLALPACQRPHVFQAGQFMKIGPQLILAPFERFSEFPAAERDFVGAGLLPGGLVLHVVQHQREQLLAGPGHVLDGLAKERRGQFVGDGDVIHRGLNVVAAYHVVLDRALELVKERDRQNEVEIPGVVSPDGQPVLGVASEAARTGLRRSTV